MTTREGRQADELRPISVEPGFMPYAEGSCLFSMGNTKIICTASVTTSVPDHARENGKGWVTAEYAMLPRATHTRGRRGSNSRGTEIKRLIGRSLRAGIDLTKLADHQITIDCDVLQADGGTRCASICGGFVAVALAIKALRAEDKIPAGAIQDVVAAVSVGVVDGEPRLDLEYIEDSAADADANLAMTGNGDFIEVQASAEGAPFSPDQLSTLLSLGDAGIKKLMAAQLAALGLTREELLSL